MNAEDTLLVGYQENPTILTIAKRVEGVMVMINAYDGEEASNLYAALTTINPKITEYKKGEINEQNRNKKLD